MNVHPSHDMETEHGAFCALCSLSPTDERIEEKCFEEPRFDPYSAPDAWEGGFAANH